jgi:hypothetical protein
MLNCNSHGKLNKRDIYVYLSNGKERKRCNLCKKDWRDKNKKKLNKWRRAYYAMNREKIIKKQAIYYQNHKEYYYRKKLEYMARNRRLGRGRYAR